MDRFSLLLKSQDLVNHPWLFLPYKLGHDKTELCHAYQSFIAMNSFYMLFKRLFSFKCFLTVITLELCLNVSFLVVSQVVFGRKFFVAALAGKRPLFMNRTDMSPQSLALDEVFSTHKADIFGLHFTQET